MVNLLALAADLPQVQFEPGATVVREHDVAGGLWVLVSGRLEVRKGEVVGLAFLVELEFLKGRERLEGRKVTSVISY